MHKRKDSQTGWKGVTGDVAGMVVTGGVLRRSRALTANRLSAALPTSAQTISIMSLQININRYGQQRDIIIIILLMKSPPLLLTEEEDRPHCHSHLLSPNYTICMWMRELLRSSEYFKLIFSIICHYVIKANSIECVIIMFEVIFVAYSN